MPLAADKLDKKARDALPGEHFAVPGKRKLPIHDERHTRLAWDMVDRTQGLTPQERSAARQRILKRAHELGLDTADWHKVRALRLDAMALNIAPDDGHPNKMPFSGVLVRLDEMSDEPPGGSGGRRIVVTSEAAANALASLLGMAVDFTPAFDGHDTQAKIGLITSAQIEGNAIVVEGFIYAADFPEIAATIKATQAVLGFSFEAQRIVVSDPAADVLTITELAFTGAAILRKDKAAYQTTSLAANAAQELDMTKEELQALLGESLTSALKPVTDRLDKIEAEAKDASDKLEANRVTIGKVEPHAKSLEQVAAAMEGDGIGCAASSGHVHVLRRMASAMRAEAAIGRVPHIFRDHDYPYSAAAKPGDVDVEAAVKKAVEAATAPLTEQLKSANTQIADLKAAARKETVAPERKTLSPAITTLLAKANLSLPEGETKLSIAKVDDALKAANLSLTQRLTLKNELSRVGAL